MVRNYLLVIFSGSGSAAKLLGGRVGRGGGEGRRGCAEDARGMRGGCSGGARGRGFCSRLSFPNCGRNETLSLASPLTAEGRNLVLGGRMELTRMGGAEP